MIQQAAPGGKDSLALGRQTGPAPPANSTEPSEQDIIFNCKQSNPEHEGYHMTVVIPLLSPLYLFDLLDKQSHVKSFNQDASKDK